MCHTIFNVLMTMSIWLVSFIILCMYFHAFQNIILNGAPWASPQCQGNPWSPQQTAKQWRAQEDFPMPPDQSVTEMWLETRSLAILQDSFHCISSLQLIQALKKKEKRRGSPKEGACGIHVFRALLEVLGSQSHHPVPSYTHLLPQVSSFKVSNSKLKYR